MEERIPYWYTKLGETEAKAVANAIAEGRLSQGGVSQAFETELADYLGVAHVVTTTSGTSALHLAAVGLGIGHGDEVIMPDRTFIATAHAVLMTGASVKLVDVLPDRTTIDAAKIEAAITPKTKAILPVHLNGNACDMPEIRRIAERHGLLVFEDAAQAFGSRTSEGYLGTLSDIGCFSLGVTKLITTGQGGFVATNDAERAERMRRYRSHGVSDTYQADYKNFGFNLRLTDLQASIGRVQFTKVPGKIKAHLRFHAAYKAALADLPFVRLLDVNQADGNVPLWAEALVADRDQAIALLEKRNIQARPFLPNLSLSPHLGKWNDDDFPNSQYFAKHGLFLPSGPDMPIEHVERVAQALREIAPLLENDLQQFGR